MGCFDKQDVNLYEVSEEESSETPPDKTIVLCPKVGTLPEILSHPGLAPPFMDAPERVIGTIIIGNSDLPEMPAFVFREELATLAEQHGFEVMPAWNSDTRGMWMRDSQIGLQSGALLLPINRKDVGVSNTTDMEYVVRYMLPRDSYMFIEQHPDCGQTTLKVFSEENREAEARDHQDLHGLTLMKCHSCVEGGNILVTARGAIVGEASVIQTMLALEYQGAFDQTLIDEHLMVMGQPSGEALKLVREGLQRVHEDEWIQWKADTEPLVYLAKLDIARHVIASDLGLSLDEVVVVEQPGFHLDVAMAVGPGGVIFLQDHQLSLDLLDELLLDCEDPPPDLARYREQALVLAGQMASSTDRIHEQLIMGGYKVARLPGVFTGGPLGSDTPQVNFFNHLGGTNREGEMFYITNAAPHPSGGVLQEQFAKTLMKQHGYQHVHFIGGDKASESLGTGGALRCLTCVLPPKLE